MSNFDRIIRFIVVLILVGIVFSGALKGILAILLIAICIPFLLASLTAHCPFYKSTNLSTYNYKDFEDFEDFKDM